MLVRADDGSLIEATSAEALALTQRRAMRADLAARAEVRAEQAPKTLDTGDDRATDTALAAPADDALRASHAAPKDNTGPAYSSPAVEAEHPEQVWRCRVAVGQNTWHVVSAVEPHAELDDRGKLTGVQWEPMDIPQSDQVLYLDWTAVAGFSFRVETAPRALRRLFGIEEPKKPEPEENPKCVLLQCPTCHASNAYSRRRCRECSGPITSAKRAYLTAQRRAAKEAEGEPAPKAKAKAKSKPKKRRAAGPELKTCRACGATVERTGAVKKMGRCPECNSIEGW